MPKKLTIGKIAKYFQQPKSQQPGAMPSGDPLAQQISQLMREGNVQVQMTIGGQAQQPQPPVAQPMPIVIKSNEPAPAQPEVSEPVQQAEETVESSASRFQGAVNNATDRKR